MNELRVTREVCCAPNVVLKGIRAAANEWCESAIPAPLRRDGVRRVCVTITTDRFELCFEGGELRMGTVRLRGQVLATPAGSTVKARVTRVSTAALGAGALATLGFVSVATGNSDGWFLILLSAPAAAIAYFQAGTIPDWMQPRARYLLACLYEALDRSLRESTPGPEPDGHT